jgi:hypothetical protein
MNILDLPHLPRETIFLKCDFEAKLNLSISCRSLQSQFKQSQIWEAGIEEICGKFWKKLFAELFSLCPQIFAKNPHKYSNFINMLFENILFNNYLADYYEAYLFPGIPLEAKIFRILKDFIRRGHITRCDPCAKFCLINENDEFNFYHQQDETHKQLEKIHSQRQERSRDKLCGICNDEVISKQNFNGDLLPSIDRRFALFEKCNHTFCLKCIEAWMMTGTCPVCTTTSNYVIPSEYWIECEKEKNEYFEQFKSRISERDSRDFKIGDNQTRIFLGPY